MTSENLSIEPLPGTSSDKHVYSLKGPFVLGTMFAIQEVLGSGTVSTILDLTEVPYMDSAGLGVLTNAYVSHQKHGYRLLLVGVNERLQALFKLTRLDSLFEIFPTVESALRALGSPAQSSVA
jgi:anti-sigma B factor antagonist